MFGRKLSRLKRAYLVTSAVLLALTAYVVLTVDLPLDLGLTKMATEIAIDFVEGMGYPGIFALMALESALVPIPSEVVIPFSGYLCQAGIMDFWTVVMVASTANLVGSIGAYCVGRRYGREFVRRYGRYLLVGDEDLKKAEKWFERYGAVSIFVARVMPAIRTVISLPAGIGKMRPVPFVILTFAGSVPWNFVLTYLGFELGRNWMVIEALFKKIDIMLIVSLALALIYVILLRKSSLEA